MATPINRKSKAGRPTLMTDVVIRKLEECFALGASDKEACLYADIAPATLYKYQEKNPEFVERKELLKEKPILLARRSVVEALKDDPQLALKYLERKRKKEFAAGVDVTSDGKAISQPAIISTVIPRAGTEAEATNGS